MPEHDFLEDCLGYEPRWLRVSLYIISSIHPVLTQSTVIQPSDRQQFNKISVAIGFQYIRLSIQSAPVGKACYRMSSLFKERLIRSVLIRISSIYA